MQSQLDGVASNHRIRTNSEGPRGSWLGTVQNKNKSRYRKVRLTFPDV